MPLVVYAERVIIQSSEIGNHSDYTIILILHYVSTDDEQWHVS